MTGPVAPFVLPALWTAGRPPRATLLLRRIRMNEHGVFGRLRIERSDGATLDLVTAEDDWKDNQPFESCIPVGRYTLMRRFFNGGGYWTFEITKVPGRSHILIHKGNTENDVKGCVAVGMVFGRLRVKRDEDTGESNVMKDAVLESGKAFDELFYPFMEGIDEAIIDIVWSREDE